MVYFVLLVFQLVSFVLEHIVHLILQFLDFGLIDVTGRVGLNFEVGTLGLYFD